MYINKLSVSYNDSDKTYENNDITNQLLEDIKISMDKQELNTIVLKNTEKDKSLNIFYEDNQSFIGIIYNEETFYYYDNGEKPSEDVEIDGGYYDNRFISHDNNLTYEIFKEFALTGELYSEVEWIEE